MTATQTPPIKCKHCQKRIRKSVRLDARMFEFYKPYCSQACSENAYVSGFRNRLIEEKPQDDGGAQ